MSPQYIFGNKPPQMGTKPDLSIALPRIWNDDSGAKFRTLKVERKEPENESFY